VRDNWSEKYPKNVTTLVEIIHPETKVHVKYGDRQDFVVIGANNCKTLSDYGYSALCKLAKKLGLPVTEVWQGESLRNLVAYMKDRSVKNQEGYVIRFKSGLRVKLKFETYIAIMIDAKLKKYTYLMNRLKNGTLEQMLATVEEEAYMATLEKLGRIMLALSTKGDAKDKWRELYKIVPPEESTPYFKGICREFVKSMVSATA